jgi:membrane associated rhomboid family serine protease
MEPTPEPSDTVTDAQTSTQADAGWLLLSVACVVGFSFAIGGFAAVLVNGSFDLSFGSDLIAAVLGAIFGVVSGIALRRHARRPETRPFPIPTPVLIAIGVVCAIAFVIGLTVHTNVNVVGGGLSDVAVVVAAECFFAFGLLACGRVLYRRRRVAAVES